jgi:hypothetical protein
MHIGIVTLGGANHDMVYVDYNVKDKNLPTPSIPVFSYDGTPVYKIIAKHRLNIIGVFVTREYIPDEDTVILVCKMKSDFTPCISYGNSKGFVCADLLFAREFAKRLSHEDKNKIRDCISSLNARSNNEMF